MCRLVLPPEFALVAMLLLLLDFGWRAVNKRTDDKQNGKARPATHRHQMPASARPLHVKVQYTMYFVYTIRHSVVSTISIAVTRS